LAGLIQSCAQVEQLAKTGYLNNEEFETSIKSLFVTSPDSAIDVFGDVAYLCTGFEKLELMLNEYHRSLSTDLFRYVFGVMHIQRRLSKRKDILTVIGTRLEQAEMQSEHFGIAHDNLVRNIATIYSDTISKFQYRIQVTGNYTYLQQDRVANQVRTLLLAGIRASTLWRQIGGTRWQFITNRENLLNTCRELQKEAKDRRFSGVA
jgi:high frequency lysogenization protein